MNDFVMPILNEWMNVNVFVGIMSIVYCKNEWMILQLKNYAYSVL